MSAGRLGIEGCEPYGGVFISADLRQENYPGFPAALLISDQQREEAQPTGGPGLLFDKCAHQAIFCRTKEG